MEDLHQTKNGLHERVMLLLEYKNEFESLTNTKRRMVQGLTNVANCSRRESNIAKLRDQC